MRTGYFLLPKRFTGNLPLDYRMEEREVDKRTRFYKNFAKWEVSIYVAVTAAERFGMRVFWENGKPTRILAPDGKTAKAYFDYMKNYFGTHE